MPIGFAGVWGQFLHLCRQRLSFSQKKRKGKQKEGKTREQKVSPRLPAKVQEMAETRMPIGLRACTHACRVPAHPAGIRSQYELRRV
jgi:hypothetical protein